MKNKENTTFQTTSLYMAAAIMACDLPLSNLQRRIATRCIFEFNHPDAPGIAERFMARSLHVDAQTLFTRFDDLRSLVKRGGA